MEKPSFFTFTFKLETSDLVALSGAVRRQSLKRMVVLFVMAISSLGLGLWGTLYIFPYMDVLPLLVLLDISGIAFVILLLSFRRYFLSQIYDKDDVHTFSEKTYTLDATGIHVKNPYTDSVMHWPLVRSVQKTKSHIFLFIGKIQAYIIPCRLLPEGVSAEEFIARIEEWRTAKSA